jgi:lipopolysaccharide export system permease protein
LIIDSEIVALTNAGVSRFSLSKPVLIIAIVMTIVSYCTTLYLLPISYSNFKDKINFYKENFTSIMLEEKVFNSKIKGLTIYIDERQKDGLLKSILIYDERNAEKPITMIAESGSFIRENNTLKLELKHGSRQELNSKGELSVLYFNYLIHELNISPPKKGTRWRETEERFIEELLFPKENLPEMLKGKLRAEGHQRLAWPLYNIVLSLLALIAVYPSEFDRKHQNKRIIICSTIAIVIVLSFFAMLNVTARFPMLYPFIYLKIILVSLLEYRYLFSDRVLKSI